MRNRYLLIADVPVIAAAAWGAFALRFGWFFMRVRPEFAPYLLAVLLVKPTCFYVTGMYRRYWQYASVDDLLALSLSVAVSTVVLAVTIGAAMMTNIVGEFSRSIVLIDGLLTLTMVGGVRIGVRVFGESRDRRRGEMRVNVRRVIVAGAGNAGVMVVREIQKNPQLGMIPVAFLDDDTGKIGKWIHHVQVVSTLDALEAVSRERRATEVVIAMPKVPGETLRAVTAACARAGLPYRTVPGMFELVDGRLGVTRLREVEITDLLRREPILGPEDKSAFVAGRCVLVTGAGGSIGSELCRQLLRGSPRELVLLGHGENSVFELSQQLQPIRHETMITSVIADIRDTARIEQVFAKHRPAVVFHAAAHKHVPLMQHNSAEAVVNNVFGTRVVVEAALQHGVEQFVLISTDKAVGPTSIMGATKRLAEAIVQRAGQDHRRAFVVVRFGNVLGSRGSVVPILKRQIEAGGPVQITHPEIKRFFMTIPEAVLLILRAASIGRGGELFVLDMGEPIRIVDLAKDLMALSAVNPDGMPIVFTGLRPGEKLEEVLWENGALVNRTGEPHILSVNEGPLPSWTDLSTLVDELIGHASAGRLLDLEAVLATAVPTYSPAQPANVRA